MKHYFISPKFGTLSKHYELCESCGRHPVQSTFSSLLFLYTISWRYKRDYVHVSRDILFKLCIILLTCWRNIRLFYTAFLLMIQKRSRFEPGPPSPLFVDYLVRSQRITYFFENGFGDNNYKRKISEALMIENVSTVFEHPKKII